VIFARWRVCLTPAELQVSAAVVPFEAGWAADWSDWLAREGLLPGTPFLLSPTAEYDVVLNGFSGMPGWSPAPGGCRRAMRVTWPRS
jgi:hypothetical protein